MVRRRSTRISYFKIILSNDSKVLFIPPLFSRCKEIKPQESITPFVDGVIDSSRYYVLRIKDPASSRTTLLGVGFREREVAFDFKQALNDYVRYVDRMAAAKAMHLQAENAPGHGPEASDGDNEVCLSVR